MASCPFCPFHPHMLCLHPIRNTDYILQHKMSTHLPPIHTPSHLPALPCCPGCLGYIISTLDFTSISAVCHQTSLTPPTDQLFDSDCGRKSLCVWQFSLFTSPVFALILRLHVSPQSLYLNLCYIVIVVVFVNCVIYLGERKKARVRIPIRQPSEE